MYYEDERTAVFIDGMSLYSASRALGFEVDYKRLRLLFAERCKLVRIFYYTVLLDTEEHSPLRPLVDWLNYNGYQMRTKVAREHFDASGRRKIKGNLDVELVIDAVELSRHIDHAVIFSGNSDYLSLVGYLQRLGIRVTVISTIAAPQSQIADELRRQADLFIDLDDMREEICRPEEALHSV